jgi:hypothetical protein
MPRFIRTIIRVEKGEAGLVIALSALHFLVILGFTLARVARDGFLLAQLDARRLPYVSLALAPLTLLGSAGASRLTKGASGDFGLARIAIVSGLSLVAFSPWFRAGGAVSAIAFYLWTGVYGLLYVSQFWIVANERVDPRQARRLFGLIGAGGVSGGLAAGAAVSLAAHSLTPATLLLWVACIHGLTALLAARGLPHERSEPTTTGPAIDERLGTALRRPYVRLLTLVFLVGGAASGVLDYLFKLTLQQGSADPTQITARLGFFYGAQNILALAAQLGFTGFVLSRLGTRRASACLPAGVLAGSALATLVPAFPAVFGARLFDATMRASLARTADEFLFFPMADAVRRPVKRFLDGPVARTSEAFSGLLVLGVNALLAGTPGQVAGLASLLAGAWLFLQRRLDPVYAGEMSNALDRMLVGPRSPSTTLEEAGAAAHLILLLDSSDERHIIYAMDRLGTIAPDALRERADRLLVHSSAAVRRRALTLPLPAASSERASTTGPEDALPSSIDAARLSLATRGDDPDADVRHAAYRSIGLAGRRESVSILVARLSRSADRPFVREALAAFGERILGELGDSLVDPGVPAHSRREIPRVLAELGTQDAANSLLRAAGDVSDRTLIQRTLWALDRIRKHDVSVTLPLHVVEQHLAEEAQRYSGLLVLRAAADGGPEDAGARLLARALDERLLQCRERLFRRLGLLYAPREMLRAHRALMSPNARTRAQSTEFLDTVLQPAHRALLAPLLADVAEQERPRWAAARLGRLVPSWPELVRELAASGDVWLRTCAVFSIGSRRDRDLAAVVSDAEFAPDETLRQLATWARSRLAAA